MSLTNKIDFALILKVKNANPNGDPLNGNRPRTNYDGFGEITDVCLKRKIRDRLHESGHSIFVQSDEKKTDQMNSLRERAESAEYGLGKESFDAKKTTREQASAKACQKWMDVRSFGQVFAFKKDSKKDTKESDAPGVSIAIRGPVTIQSAFSLEPVSVTSTQITKSVNGEGDGSKKASDTMGMKHRVDDAVYVTFGAMTPQLAEKTGFSNEDSEEIKKVMLKLFENDASSARPEGSMEVLYIVWWRHNSKLGQYSSAKVHATLSLDSAGKPTLQNLSGLEPEIISGF